MNQLSIIWNITRRCVWNCSFCCVGAITNEIENNDELSFDNKIKIIDKINNINVRIDFSGGELLIDPDNIEVVLYASKKIGAENIGISTSGAKLDLNIISKLKNKISDVELTLDCLPNRDYMLRPRGYHETADRAIKLLKKHDFKIGIQTVLTNCNMNKKNIEELYNYINKNKIESWSLLRFFSSGRGILFDNITPTAKEYENFIGYMRDKYSSGPVDLHFQYLLPNHPRYTPDCRAVKKSIGILPNGSVIACFWALDINMNSIDNKLILGKLPEEELNSILNNEKSHYWKSQYHKCILFKDNKDLTSTMPTYVEREQKWNSIHLKKNL